MKINCICKTLFIALLSFYGSVITAQVNKSGMPNISTYPSSVTGGSEWNYDIVRDSRGILYLGNENGSIIEFDGRRWNAIPVNGHPVILALEKDPDGVIYAGGSFQFGYLDPNERGVLEYVSLSDQLDSAIVSKIGDVFNIKYFEGDLYFISKPLIFRYNKTSDKLDVLNDSSNFYATQEIYSVRDRLFIADNRLGITEFKDDSLNLLPGGGEFGMDYCMTLLPYDSTWLLVGGFYRGLCLYNPETGEIKDDFVSESLNNEFKTRNIFTSLILPDGNFAIGTTSGGVYIINREGELVMLISNSTTSMADDQTYHLYMDPDGDPSSQLWISTVGYLHKVGYNLPFRVFDKRNNISYAINDICEFNGRIYMGGDKGVLKMSYSDNNVVFEDIEGLDDPIISMASVSEGGKEFLLVGGLSGLSIIDKNDKVVSFKDVMEDSEEVYNPDYIRQLKVSSYEQGRFYAGYARKIRIFNLSKGLWYFSGFVEGGIMGKIHSIAEESADKIWIVTFEREKLYTIDFSESKAISTEYTGKEMDGLTINSVSEIDSMIYVSTDSGIFFYNSEEGKFDLAENLILTGRDDVDYKDIMSVEGFGYIVSAYDYQDLLYLVKPDGTKIIDAFYNIPNSYTTALRQVGDKLLISKFQKVYTVDLDAIGSYYEDNHVLIRNVRVSQDSLLFGGTFYDVNEYGHKILMGDQPKSMIPRINHAYNDLSFSWSSSNLVIQDSTVYSFMIENFDDGWSRWEKVYYKDYTNLPHGKYKFKVRARGVNRQISKIAVYEFEIERAWYQSIIALLIYLILIVLFIFGIIKVYTRRLISENLRLEGIVEERTREVVRQKDELEASIHYASRIQRAILPTERSLKDKVNDYFILFRPRDIVSGDFYWVSQKGSRLFIVAADCTGHGVPGAFMSILGVSFLDEIINKTDNTEPDKILNQLRSHVTDSLKQLEGGEEETKDGMDLGILVINFKEELIEFSGAYNPCWLVRELTLAEKEKYVKGELELDRASLSNGKHILTTIEADRMPIGVSSRMEESFTMHKRNMDKEISYYLFSDGYSDQFGGEKGRKFLKKNLKKLILDIQDVPMKKQRELLEKKLIDWMGSQEQVDDILIMGIKAV